MSEIVIVDGYYVYTFDFSRKLESRRSRGTLSHACAHEYAKRCGFDFVYVVKSKKSVAQPK